MKTKFTLFILLASIFVSCEKDANIPVPVIEKMMAVTAFLEEGKNITLTLENVVPVFANPRQESGPVTGATVLISDGVTSEVLQEDAQIIGTYYSTNMGFVKAGGAYTLKITHPDYPTLTASCVVPTYLPDDAELDYVSSPNPTGETDSLRRAGLRWQDKSGEKNYYRFAANSYMTGNQISALFFADKNLADESKDGEMLFSGLAEMGGNFSGVPNQSLEIEFELIALDISSYKYMRTLDISYYSEDNPFAEPVIMYSNVKGGIGIFGGIKRKTYTFDVY